MVGSLFGDCNRTTDIRKLSGWSRPATLELDETTTWT